MTEINHDIIKKRIQHLRNELKQKQITAYVALTSDPHLSEYLPEHWQTRKWLSGFTGSAATLVVTQNSAELWVDSRYWEQADTELKNMGIEVQRQVSLHYSYAHWLATNLPTGSIVAIEGATLSIKAKAELLTTLNGSNIKLDTQVDLISAVWHDRPPLPKNAIYDHMQEYCSQSRKEKLAQLRLSLKVHDANAHIISSLDDIAWLLNLRGSDVTYNPVFLAHFWLTPENAILFVDQNKISPTTIQHLTEDGVEIANYSAILPILKTLPADIALLFDPAKTTCLFIESVPSSAKLIMAINPTTLSKACKTEQDIAHICQAMEEDGAALCEFFAWLEKALAEKQSISELTIDSKLLEMRQKQPHFVCESFSTIAGFNANSALPHYRATPESYAEITGHGLLLIDSGGQYHNGTTDITRVVPVGNITDAHKRDFTLVLKGMIALSRTSFPEGIASPLLDAIARAPLWANQMNYGHGTGHGIGYFLNVHEDPQIISYHAPSLPQTSFLAGMITSIEPGHYRPTQWGVRIENLVVNRPVSNPKENHFGQFLCFETLTLCPIDARCMELTLLTDEEIDWLNHYHQQVYQRLSPKLSDTPLAWLTLRTEPIIRMK